MKKNWLKRSLSLLLVVGMLLGLVGCGKDGAGSSSSSGDYSETVSFSCTTYYSLLYADAGYDLAEDEFYKYICDKFNVEIDAWANSAGDTNTQVWINGNSLPDMFIMEDMSHLEVVEYANMGALKPLPDGWKKTWPNLAKMVEASNAEEVFSADGKLYMIPHASFGNLAKQDTLTEHASLYYRKDWAAQVGMENLGESGVITISELKQYFDKVKQAGLCANSYLGTNMELFQEMVEKFHGVNVPTFYNDGNGYEFKYAMDEYIDVIAEMRQWRDSGYVNPNFTTEPLLSQFQKYWYGQLPACLYGGSVGEFSNMFDQILLSEGYDTNDMEQREALWDQYGIAAIALDDGTVMTREVDNWWLLSGFSPNCSDEAMTRILDMIDYFCTEEGEISAAIGIKGEHWDYAEDGTIEMLSSASSIFEVSPSRFFFVWGYGDDVMYNYGSKCPGVYDYEVELVNKLYDVRAKGTVVPIDEKYDMLTTDSYRNFSINTTATLGELIYSQKDIKTEWNKFLNDFGTMTNALLEDLNK